MIIDTSAVIAILKRESDSLLLSQALEAADTRRMSVATWVECSMVAETRGRDGLLDLDMFMRCARIELMPVDVEQGRLAHYGFSRFGKGRHPAALNYGDCFAYALARQLSEPLLCKGGDFAKTDITLVPIGPNQPLH